MEGIRLTPQVPITLKTPWSAIISLLLSIFGIIGGPLIGIMAYVVLTAQLLPKLEIPITADYHLSLYILLAMACPFLCLVGLVAGIVAFTRIKNQATVLKGKGWALGAIITGALGTFFWGGIVVMFLIMQSSSQRIITTRFDSATYKGPMGTVILPYKEKTDFMLNHGSKSMWFCAENGMFQAPVGKYTLYTCNIRAAKANNTENMVTIFADGGSLAKEFSVQADKPCTLEFGPPLKASIIVTPQSDNNIFFDFKLVDHYGNRANLANSSPAFQVMNQAGDIVWQDKFPAG